MNFGVERFDQTRRHFDYYLRAGKKWPVDGEAWEVRKDLMSAKKDIKKNSTTKIFLAKTK